MGPSHGILQAAGLAHIPTALLGHTHPDDPLRFDFIVDSGNTDFTDEEVKKESERLVKYFLAAMTVAVDDPANAARVLADNGVSFHSVAGDALVVPPAETHGVVLELTRAEA